VKLIKFLAVAGGGLTTKRGTFGDKGKLDSMLCCTFTRDGRTLSGAGNGLLYLYAQLRLAQLE
jgi:hypothetical protein